MGQMGPGRPTQTISGPIRTPFDLAASRTIYSPLVKSYTAAAEEQRSLRDTISERRVVHSC
jgi:hypothetical protein